MPEELKPCPVGFPLPEWYHRLNEKVHQVIGGVALCRQGEHCVFPTEEAIEACSAILAAVRDGIYSDRRTPSLSEPSQTEAALRRAICEALLHLDNGQKKDATIILDRALASSPAPKAEPAPETRP